MAPKSPEPSKISRSKAIQAIRRKIAERPDSEAIWKVVGDFERRRAGTRTNDRALALVLGAILEQGLETAILSHCIELDDAGQKNLFQGGEDGALAFGPKIRLGYALGIYGLSSRADLDCMRHIRNLFAHTKTPMNFRTQEVQQTCAHIGWPNLLVWNERFRRPRTARQLYVETVRHFFAYFVVEARKGAVKYVGSTFPDIYV